MYFTLSMMISRILSTCVFEAASNSITFSDVPAAISSHMGHTPHGLSVGPFTQFSALAKMRAVLVFPVPRGPTKRYACASRFCPMAFFSVRTMCSCPTISSKVCGRYLRAKTV